MKKSFILLIFIKAYLCTTEKSDYEDEYENNDSNESSEVNFYRDGDDESKEYFDETTTIFPIPPLNSSTTTVWPNLTTSFSTHSPSTSAPFNITSTKSEEECDTTTSETDTTKNDDTTIPPTIFDSTTSSANISTPSSNSTTTTESSTLSETDTTTTDMDTTTITEGGK